MAFRRLRRYLVGTTLFGLAMAACSSNENSKPILAWNGSRLRARVLVGDDGARQRIGWWDAERSEPCAFSRADDARIRCLPTSVAVRDAFTDGTCGEAIATIGAPQSPGCESAPPKYASRLDRDGCDAATFFPVIGPLEEFRQLCRGLADGSTCKCFPDKTRGVRVGEPIPAASFVESSIMLEGQGRIRNRVRKSTDGATEWLGFYDTTMGATCTFVPLDPDNVVCVPQKFRATFGYAVSRGPSCGVTDPNAVLASCSGEPPPSCEPPESPPEVRHVVEGKCGTLPSVRRIGGVAPGDYSASHYDKGTSQTTCSRVTACLLEGEQNAQLERRGKFAELAAGDVVSGTRLLAYPPGLRSCWEDSDVGHKTRWHDGVLAMDCVFDVAMDGETRCLPLVRYDVSVDASRFVDPACSKPLVRFVTPPPSPVVIGLADERLFQPPGPKCRPTRGAYRAEPVTQAKIFTKTLLECVPAEGPPIDGWAITPLSPTELVRAQIVVE